MKPASCPHCGDQVMPYRRFALHLGRGATCESCSRRVRVRGFYPAVIGGLLLGIGFMAWYSMSDGDGALRALLMMGVLTLIAVALDYALWRWVGFDAEPERVEDVTVGGTPAA